MAGIKESAQTTIQAASSSNKNKKSLLNLPSNYSRPCAVFSDSTPRYTFEVIPGESITYTQQNYVTLDLNQIKTRLDSVDLMIIEEVARSRYLTSLQIAELISMRTVPYSRDAIHKHLNKLVSLRTLRQKMICRSNARSGLRFYELDIFGYELVKDRVVFHSGNRYLSFRKRQDLGLEEMAHDVKRILCANQIVIGMLKNGARIERFGIQEVFAAPDHRDAQNGAILRVPANLIIDSQSLLAYEVVRDLPESMNDFLEKHDRYYKLCDRCPDGISHTALGEPDEEEGLPALPQLVICGENRKHNLSIHKQLKEAGLLREKDPLLYTEDALNLDDSLVSLYEIKDDESLQWYRIPGVIQSRRF